MSAAGEGAAGAGDGGLLLNQPIVIDNGTASIKTGFAGSSKPKVRTNFGMTIGRRRLWRATLWLCR
jgi:hypothetical protein